MRSKVPVLVGVGQVVERLEASDYQTKTAIQLACEAVEAALSDTHSEIRGFISAMTVIRTFPDSVPKKLQPFLAPFGWSNNFAGSVADGLGFSDVTVTYSGACGNEPQKWVGRYAQQIAIGEITGAIICGAEAIATMRKAKADGHDLDWSSESSYPVQDGGMNTDFMVEGELIRHGAAVPTSVYPLLEQARRLQRQESSDQYAQHMGELFAPFTEVAANNPYSMSQKRLEPAQIAEVTASNRMVSDPYPKAVIARDWVNQAAAVVIIAEDVADALGICQSQRVYLHGHADSLEKPVLERSKLAASEAMSRTYDQALACAGKRFDEMDWVDIYSCFPVAVFNVLDHYDLPTVSDRAYTLTGGLPFFGGPGNNYSLHAIASAVDRLRQSPGSFALVGANGGYLSKHSVGVYSTQPCEWRPNANEQLQAGLDQIQSVVVETDPSGVFELESYTILYKGEHPQLAIIIARSPETDKRAVATSVDQLTILALSSAPPKTNVTLHAGQPMNTFELRGE